MTSKSAFEISSDQKVHLGSAATKIGKFSWPATGCLKTKLDTFWSYIGEFVG